MSKNNEKLNNGPKPLNFAKDGSSVDFKKFRKLIKKNCIALTGSIATGKSTVLSMLSDEGFTVFSADDFAKKITTAHSPVNHEIEKIFGPESINSNGELNRPFLRKAIFTYPEKKRLLESITHPAIRLEFAKNVMAPEFSFSERAFFYEVPLLFEKDLAGDFLASVLTVCPEKVQISRLTARDSISEEEAIQTLKSQMPQSEKKRHANFIISTDSSLTKLRDQVRKLRVAINGIP